ncbi:kgd2, partial [Symbiodinium sp. CCMP2456]
PEWCLPHRHCPGRWEDGTSAGGIISWAVEPASLSLREGFEVCFRDEPGPTSADDEDLPDRTDSDF